MNAVKVTNRVNNMILNKEFSCDFKIIKCPAILPANIKYIIIEQKNIAIKSKS